MTVKEMLHRMDSRELTEQIAYDHMRDVAWFKNFKREQRFKEYMKEHNING